MFKTYFLSFTDKLNKSQKILKTFSKIHWNQNDDSRKTPYFFFYLILICTWRKKTFISFEMIYKYGSSISLFFLLDCFERTFSCWQIFTQHLNDINKNRLKLKVEKKPNLLLSFFKLRLKLKERIINSNG